MVEYLPAELTIYVQEGGDWRLKLRIDEELRGHPMYRRVIGEGGRFVLRDSQAPEGNPLPGRAREGNIAGVPGDVDYDWQMRGSDVRDSLVGWKRDGEMTVYKATLAGEPMLTRTEVAAFASDGSGARSALDSLTRPATSYPVGEWLLETDWEGRARNGNRVVPVFL